MRDAVTPEMAAFVFTRDGGCVAPRLGGSALDCYGRLTLEHVKDTLRMAKRAPSDPAHLVSLCEGHTEPGRRAGYQWNSTRENRAKVRDYLANVRHYGHVDPCSPECPAAKVTA